MRLLLANGTKLSVKSYNNTTALVDGNTVPALSIVINESLDSVNEKLKNKDALLDFNIYPDDKSVVLLHGTGYQKRVSTSFGDDENVVTVVLAKTTDSEVILKRVEKLLTDIQSTQETQQESIGSLTKTVNDTVKVVNDTTTKLKAIDETIANIGLTLEDITKHMVKVNNHIDENDALCNKISESISNFAQISEQHIASMQSMRNDLEQCNSNSSNAVKAADSAVNSITKQNTAIESAVNAASGAVERVGVLSSDVETNIKGLEKVTEQVAETARLAKETNEKAASAEALENVKKSMTTMRQNFSNTSENVEKLASTVTNITGSTLPAMGNAIESAVQRATDAKDAADSAQSDISAVSDRVSKLEPITDYTTLDLDAAKEYRVKESANALAEYLAANPITSTCHKGTAAKYSITKDKQDYLQSMISVTTLAKQAGAPYQPSWNATGEVCSYDWTLEELVQLAMEIEATVRPLVSYQQTIEKAIRSCTSMDELKAVAINYNDAPKHTTTPSESAGDSTDTEEPTGSETDAPSNDETSGTEDTSANGGETSGTENSSGTAETTKSRK